MTGYKEGPISGKKYSMNFYYAPETDSLYPFVFNCFNHNKQYTEFDDKIEWDTQDKLK